MKNLFFVFVLLSVTISSSQQEDSSRITNDYSGFAVNSTGAWLKNKVDNTIKGSVYLYEEWDAKGTVKTRKGDLIKINDLNYDTENDNFVVKFSKDSLYVFDNKDIDEVVMNNRKFKEYTLDNEDRLLEVLAFNDDLEIVKKHYNIIKKGLTDPLTQKKDKDTYIKKYTVYLKKGDSFEEIRISKKSFSKLFGKNAKKVREYISKNDMSLKDDKNLQKILNFNNTL